MNTNQSQIESRLWSAADELRANSDLKGSEYSTPVLGLIFLKYTDYKFTEVQRELSLETSSGKRLLIDEKTQFQARGAFYLPEKSRFQYLLDLPESENIGQAVNDAIKAIEAENKQVQGVLPKNYNRLEKSTLLELLRIMEQIPMDIEGDAFGKVYEYFLGNFAMSEGQRGGEFFTPTSLVKLIVEIIEPFHGRILDPACGSGGMFVQSEQFIRNHQQNGNQGYISIHGVERVNETIRLCKMNLAVHGHEGDIKQANSYTESATEDEVGPKFVRGKDINKTSYVDWNTVPFCPIDSKRHAKYQLDLGDILVIRMADPGKVAIIEKNIDSVFASYLIRLKLSATLLSPYFLFYTLLDNRYQNYVVGASTGTTRKSASAGVLTDFKLIIPTKKIRKQFEAVIAQLRKTLNNLLEKNATLRQTRDILLPKLISGEIDVFELDIGTDSI